MKKLLVAILFAAIVASGAMAQLMIGLSGALHTDTKLSAADVKARFDSGQGIFYGGFVEIVGRHFGVGVTANVSSYTGDVPGSFTYLGNPIYFQVTNAKLTDYDLTAYLSYHLLGGHKLLDPFGELGGGILATGFTNQSDTDTYVPWNSNFLAASYYWYAAVGLGINLGPIGVFAKFAFNEPVNSSFSTDFKSNYGNGGLTGLSGSTTLGPYGYDANLNLNGYLPLYRITLGAKLIL